MAKKTRSTQTMQKGADRAAHFSNGGTLAQWRGRPETFTDRKKKASKSACRGRVSQ